MIRLDAEFDFTDFSPEIARAARHAVNRLAKDGQRASIQEIINGEWEIRNRWYEPKNALGIKVNFAFERQGPRPTAIVFTRASFLEKHEEEQILRPRGNKKIPVPVSSINRDPTGAIRKDLRIKNLKKPFTIQTRKGPTLFIREGKTLMPVYGLETQVHIKKNSKFFEPIESVVTPARFQKYFEEEL